ncbi:Hypothetical protein PHPALM_5435 [Phytophthora palmivora]|uniref:Uncharacterized protein n=1 Tax=Phytophthora palmivora TaxID=4796 RepID=A0A2P4YHB9_9STRA|nr:Hypothetical protein PHPALM_5435 [Phytophthora palmivora]
MKTEERDGKKRKLHVNVDAAARLRGRSWLLVSTSLTTADIDAEGPTIVTCCASTVATPTPTRVDDEAAPRGEMDPERLAHCSAFPAGFRMSAMRGIHYIALR